MFNRNPEKYVKGGMRTLQKKKVVLVSIQSKVFTSIFQKFVLEVLQPAEKSSKTCICH